MKSLYICCIVNTICPSLPSSLKLQSPATMSRRLQQKVYRTCVYVSFPFVKNEPVAHADAGRSKVDNLSLAWSYLVDKHQANFTVGHREIKRKTLKKKEDDDKIDDLKTSAPITTVAQMNNQLTVAGDLGLTSPILISSKLSFSELPLWGMEILCDTCDFVL